MKKLRFSLILLFLIILNMIPVISQQVDPENLQTLNKVKQEHANTRKFFSDELNRNRVEFFKETDKRATYYEETIENMLYTSVWKLALLWGGIMFFFTSFNTIMGNRLAKKRFTELKKSIKADIFNDLKVLNNDTTQSTSKKPMFKSKRGYDVEVDELFTNQQQQPIKKGFFTRRKEKKLRKQLLKNKKEQDKLTDELGLSVLPPPPNPPPLKEKSKPNVELEYTESFEVEY